MKVHELIAALERQDPEAYVVVPDEHDGGYRYIVDVYANSFGEVVID